MHMNPSSMDADGVLNGPQRRGRTKRSAWVSNYLDHPNGTTRHLHFDVQVFPRADGWLWVNPYTTLVSAYERLIRGPRPRDRARTCGRPPAVGPTPCRRMSFVILDAQEGGEN